MLIRSFIRPAILCAVWFAVFSAVCWAQSTVDTSLVGPRVGTTVPPFSGSDQFGRTQTLETAMGPKGVMLVFFRSADW